MAESPRDLAGLHVVVTDGHARQVLPVVRSLRKNGCRVTVMSASRWDPGWVSRWPHHRVLVADARQNSEAFLEGVIRHLKSNRADVLVPLSDCAAEAMSRNKARLEELTRVAVADPVVFERARDKLLTMRACAEAGVPHPRTVMDTPTVDAVGAAGLQFPVVVKPRAADSAVGFRRVSSVDELRRVLVETTDRFGPVLVQEYIPQDDLQYKAEFLLDRGGGVRSAVVFSKIRWYPLEGGSSTLNATVHRPDIVESSARLLRAIGWTGYADVDLIQDPRDGVCKVMEINPRVTGSVKLAFDAGVDFARQIVQEAMAWPVDDFPSYEVGRYLRFLHKDVLWFIRSPARLRSEPGWFDFRRTTDQILSFADPLPGIAYSLQAFKRLAEYGKRRNG